MNTTIPRHFHFVFGLKPQTRPFHLIHYLALSSCLNVNRPEALLFHYLHEPWGEYWDLIRERITPVPINRPRVRLNYTDRRIEAYRYAHESDFVRLDILLEHGGVYADIDTLFVNPIPAHLFDQAFVLGQEDDIVCRDTGARSPSLCNAFIMSRPEAAFGRMWRKKMAEAFDGSWSRHSTVLPAELARACPGDIHVEPPETFYRFMWRREDLRCLFEDTVPVDSTVASIHLWAHLWWARGRRDFSDTHAGRFTEDFIRNVSTTYNLLARPHLPPGERPARAAGKRFGDAAWRFTGRARETLLRAGAAMGLTGRFLP